MISAAQYLPTLPYHQQATIRRSIASAHNRSERSWKINSAVAHKDLPPFIRNRVAVSSCKPEIKQFTPKTPSSQTRATKPSEIPIFFGFSAHDDEEGLCPFAKTEIDIPCNLKRLASADHKIYDVLGKFQYKRHIAKDHPDRKCPDDQLCTNTINYVAQDVIETLRTWLSSKHSQNLNHPTDDESESLNTLFEAVVWTNNIYSYRYAIRLKPVKGVVGMVR